MQSPCVLAEGSDEFVFRFALALKFGNEKSVQNIIELTYRLRDEYSQEKRRYLCGKLQDQKDKQNKRNTWMRPSRKLLLLNSVVDTL